MSRAKPIKKISDLRVCMLAYTFYDRDNRVIRYAESLSKLGAHVDVVALRKHGQGNFDIINNVRVHRIQERVVDEKGALSYLYRIIIFFLKSTVFLTKNHLKVPYHIIHVHSVPDFEVFAALVPKLMGSKIILDIHDIVPEFYLSKFNVDHNSLIYKLLLLCEKLSISFSDHIVIANHIWAERLISRSIKSSKCSVILNYPDSSVFYPRSKNILNNGKFVIMYPGSLNWHQGLDIAIKAFATIKEEVPNACLYVYGEGQSKEDLIKITKQLGVENQVKFKEYLPIWQIAEIMAMADLGIVPKRNTSFGGEAFSTKTFEFMALGVPIIVSKTKIDDFYFNDKIVKYFEPENEKDLCNALLSMIKDKKLREKQAKNAIKYIANNNWDVNKSKYLDLVNSLASSNFDVPRHLG